MIRRGGVENAEDDKEQNQTKYQANYEEWKGIFEKYEGKPLETQLGIWKATRFFTSSDVINLFIELLDTLERLEITNEVHSNEFKVKFDVTSEQVTKIKAAYL